MNTELFRSQGRPSTTHKRYAWLKSVGIDADSISEEHAAICYLNGTPVGCKLFDRKFGRPANVSVTSADDESDFLITNE